MYLVLICDDDLIFAQLLAKKVKDCMQERKTECEIRLYTDGEKLLQELKEVTPQAVFLDIDMPKLSGMEIAEQIFEGTVNTNVIFVTNRDDLVFEAIRYQPFRFIRKSKLEEEIEEAVLRLMDKISREEKLLELQTKDGRVVLPLRNVFYMESCKHYLLVHHQNGCCEVRDKISNYEEKVIEDGFIRIHRGFLINLRYVKCIRGNQIEMDNEVLLPISRDRIQEVKKQHMVYLRGYANANN